MILVPINFGATPIKSVQCGSTPVKAVYYGPSLVWKSGPSWIFTDDFNQPDGAISGPYTFSNSGLRYYSGAVGSSNTTTRYARCNTRPNTSDIVVRATIRTGSNSSVGRHCGIQIGDNINAPANGLLSLRARSGGLFLTDGNGLNSALWSTNYSVKNGDVVELSRKGTEIKVILNDTTLWTGTSTIATLPEHLYGGFFATNNDGVLLDDFMLGEN